MDFTLIRPSVVIRHMETYWRQEEGSGSWTCQVRDQEFVAHLSGWQGGDHVLCRRLLGYLGRMLETAGNVIWREHVHASSGDVTNCIFRFGWQLEHDFPAGDRIVSKAKLWEVARELDVFSDVASLAEVIAELVHVQLSYPYVALRVRFADLEGLTLVRDAGARSAGTAVRYMLQRSGRFIGQLDVEVGPESRQDLLDELVPLLALPLDATRLSELQVSPEGTSLAASSLPVGCGGSPPRNRCLGAADARQGLQGHRQGARLRAEHHRAACGPRSAEIQCKSRSMLSWVFWMEL